MAATPEKQVGAEPQAAPMPRRLLQTQTSPTKGPAPMQVESSGEERLQRAQCRAGTQLLEGPGQAADQGDAREHAPQPKQAAPQQDQAVDQGVPEQAAQQGQEAVGLPSVLSMAEDSSSIIAIVVVAMRLVYRTLAKHEMAT